MTFAEFLNETLANAVRAGYRPTESEIAQLSHDYVRHLARKRREQSVRDAEDAWERRWFGLYQDSYGTLNLDVKEAFDDWISKLDGER